MIIRTLSCEDHFLFSIIYSFNVVSCNYLYSTLKLIKDVHIQHDLTRNVTCCVINSW